jgi:hypothetical protein
LDISVKPSFAAGEFKGLQPGNTNAAIINTENILDVPVWMVCIKCSDDEI